MLKTLLIEIGVEELPAVPLLKELKNIEIKYAKILEEYALLGDFEFYYTPRRLVIWHREFKTVQEDSVEEFLEHLYVLLIKMESQQQRQMVLQRSVAFVLKS